jgi:hypothetical protein
VFIFFYVLSLTHKSEAWMLAPAARRKGFSINARYLMGLGMFAVVHHPINAGALDFLSWFEFRFFRHGLTLIA